MKKEEKKPAMFYLLAILREQRENERKRDDNKRLPNKREV